MELLIRRDTYTADTTIGELWYLDEDRFLSYTLEDAVRPYGVKIDKKTAIPCGRYRISLYNSPRFSRDVPIIYNCADKITLKGNGISFIYALIHGGNTHKNTDGCVLVAYNKINDYTIYKTASAEVTELIRQAIDIRGEECWLEIVHAQLDQT